MGSCCSLVSMIRSGTIFSAWGTYVLIWAISAFDKNKCVAETDFSQTLTSWSIISGVLWFGLSSCIDSPFSWGGNNNCTKLTLTFEYLHSIKSFFDARIYYFQFSNVIIHLFNSNICHIHRLKKLNRNFSFFEAFQQKWISFIIRQIQFF